MSNAYNLIKKEPVLGSKRKANNIYFEFNKGLSNVKLLTINLKYSRVLE